MTIFFSNPLTPISWLATDLREMADQFPGLARLFAVGVSADGEPLLGLRISGRSARQGGGGLLRPMVRLVGGLAGEEAVGREVATQLALHLLHGYSREPELAGLLDSVDIAILPAASPDGFRRSRKGSCSGDRFREGRQNGRGVELPTSFPGPADWQRFQAEPNYNPYQGRQPETAALMAWTAERPPVLGLVLESGWLGTTFPLQRGSADQAETRDQETFAALAEEYQTSLPPHSARCYYNAGPQGWAAGAKARLEQAGPGNATLPDFSYLFTGTLELSVGLSCCKFPTGFQLLDLWALHRPALIKFIRGAARGVRGVVFLPDNRPAAGAEIAVRGVEQERRRGRVSGEDGSYHYLLLPSPRAYTLQAEYEDCAGSGLRFRSAPQRLLITESQPTITRLVFLRPTGSCV